MTQDTEKNGPSLDNEPAKIVQIAYSQMSEMSGLSDPCIASNDGPVESNSGRTRRILQLPIFATFRATVSNMYNSVKESNEVVSSILATTEEGLEQGAKLVEPVTQKIGSTLETPLNIVDNVLCQGLDYLEAKVPQITASSGMFLTNVGSFFRSSLDSLSQFYLNAVKSITHLSGHMAIEDGNNNGQQNQKTQKN